MAEFPGISLLADVITIVTRRPALLEYPLEVVNEMFYERLGMTKKKRSVRAKKLFRKPVDGGDLIIAPVPLRIVKKCGHEMGREMPEMVDDRSAMKKVAVVPSRIVRMCKHETCLKRRGAVDDGPAMKKAAVAECPELPMEVRSAIQSLCRPDSEVKFILQKKLTMSDMKVSQGRFLFPLLQTKVQVLMDILDQEEKELLKPDKGWSIPVQVIEPCLRVSSPSLGRWKMSENYVFVLKAGWNKIAHAPDNGLAEDDMVQVWSFRSKGNVCFAIIKAITGASPGSTGPSFSSISETDP